jgi:hypothetical protein
LKPQPTATAIPNTLCGFQNACERVDSAHDRYQCLNISTNGVWLLLASFSVFGIIVVVVLKKLFL